MAPIALAFGIVLIALGTGFYFGTDTSSLTPLIPAAIGLALLLLGLLARRDRLRKHAMHSAAMVGTLGFLGGAFMAGKALVTLATGSEVARPAAAVESGIMAFLCALFVFLCIRSFRIARRRRQEAAMTDQR